MLRVFVGTRLSAIDVCDVKRVKQADPGQCLPVAHPPVRLGLAPCTISGFRTSGVWYVIRGACADASRMHFQCSASADRH